MYENPDKSHNPIICRLVPSPSQYEIRQYGPLQRVESIGLIYFRERIGGYRQSFALFTVL